MGSYLTALSRAIGIRRFVIGSTVAVILSLYGHARSWAAQHGLDLPDLPAWQLAPLIVLLLVSWRLLARTVELEKEIEPRIQIEFLRGLPFEITEPMASDGPVTRQFRVRVKNTSARNLSECLVKLESIKRLDQPAFYNAFLPIGLITQHQLLQERRGGTFSLRAYEEKFIEVALLDESKPNSEIALRYETTQYPNLIPRGEYELLLRAYSGGKPAEKRFRLFVCEGRLCFDEVI